MNKLPINIFLDEHTYNVKAFNRTKTAHYNLPQVVDNVAYNEVDSVVYVKNKKNIHHDFSVGRKYSYAIECIEGEIEVEYELIDKLNVVYEYNDLSDEELYQGKGKRCKIEAGEIAIFELNEAIKYIDTSSSFVEYKIAKDGGIK